MINIIICDDNLMDANKIERIVKRHMQGLEYQVHMFKDYNKDFMRILSSNLPNKIYLLDIETPSMSGIDVARKIRRNDYESVIIFLTGHDDLSRIIAKKNLMCLNFINKFDNLKNKLMESLDIALKLVGTKRVISLTSKGNIYNIELAKILYITRDTLTRETLIVCDNRTYQIKMNMQDIIRQLPSDFIQVHRSCYVNKKRIEIIDTRKGLITFDNNTNTSIVSKKYIESVIK